MIHLKHGPCCLQLLDDGVIAVGTYELDDELATVKTNRRKGSLCFVQDERLISENECEEDGGIFDLHHVTRDLILAAHTSGTLTLHQPSPDYKTVDAKIRSRLVDDGTQMLTSVHAVPNPNSGDECYTICTATSTGTLLLMEMDLKKGIIEKKSSVVENELKHPVWTVRCAKMDESRTVIFTGSDAGVWNTFLSHDGIIAHKPLYSNEDAGSGVTSLCTDLEVTDNGLSGRIYAGSYDENFRAYSLTVTKDGQVVIQLKECLKINGAGIWTIRPVKLQDHRLILMSGMYSGYHLLDTQTLKISSHKVGDSELIYDALMLKSTIICASFYGKSVQVLDVNSDAVCQKISA